MKLFLLFVLVFLYQSNFSFAYQAVPFDTKQVIHLRGEGKQLGLEQVKFLKSEIQGLLDGWLNPVLKSVPIIGNWFVNSKASNMEPFISRDYKDEIQAIADEMGLPFRKIVVASAIPDILEMKDKPFGCSTLVVSSKRSGNGGMLSGRNLDYEKSAILRRYWRPVVFEKTGKYKVLDLHLAGMAGVLTAINEKGVMMSRMTSYSKDITSHGTPSLILFRQVLEEASTAKEAIDLYLKGKRTVAINIMVTDGKEAFVLEVSATKHSIREVNLAGVLYSANHYVSEKMEGTHSADHRWPILSKFDKTEKLLSMNDVVETLKQTGNTDSILFAAYDYSTRKLLFGTDIENAGISAAGKLYELDLASVFIQ